ncbi:MAG: hypothetical protein COS99_07690 [Candidatus Omnitrophica bacterium CG07_land_8_20_14_0_80_42_15]|uniref:Elp3/MiaA/NifB-like radical SAM core domain-containing protein n=1 Tax=Candidatus Aquitaenariimonas noxiae TaxID=1974741 RepID=A0A2J0KQQ1_9BACT|nr:MAG: hypothetical protein COS99_07690 [Candidatus Omnitrophica bacterium CG07_land_8_20_14_0_80_42_15]
MPHEKHGDDKNYDFTKWYQSVYPELAYCGTWLRGNELNTIPTEEYNKRPLKVLFVRLSTYRDVEHSYTHSLLYQLASSLPDVFPDLAYLPPEGDSKIFAQNKIPWLLGTQTKYGPQGFNVIGFSDSIIQEILNIPLFLKNSGIPLEKSARLKRPDIPLIILGGANAPHTSSIWGDKGLVDGVFVGENPSAIRELLKICSSGYKARESKVDILKELEGVPGFFSSDGKRKTCKRAGLRPLDVELPEKGVVSYNEDQIGAGYLQISEGCRALCGFCSESWTRKPYIELASSVLLDKAMSMKARMGLERINLFSFNFNMYSEFYELIWNLLPVFKNIGLKTQRFDMIAKDPEIIEYQKLLGKSNFSCGLEGISARLRKYLNKNLKDEGLRKSFSLVFKAGVRELKIFLLCTGREIEDDFKEFGTLLKMIQDEKKKASSSTRVVFSITPLVRFPFTPLEFDASYTPEAYDVIIKKMHRRISDFNFEAREAMGVKEYLVSQILIRAEDPRIKDAILLALEESGFIYYKNVTPLFFNSFMKNLKNLGVDIQDLLRSSSLEESLKKPWAFISAGIERKTLWEAYQKNIKFEEYGPGAENMAIKEKNFTLEQFKARIKELRDNEVKKDFSVSVGERGRGILRKYFGITLARAFMKVDTSLIPYFRSYVSSYWKTDKSEPVWIIGDDIVRLAWDKKAVSILEDDIKNPNFINSVNNILGKWGKLYGIAGKENRAFKLRVESPFRIEFAPYFKSKGLRYTTHKISEKAYSLKFTKDSLRKKIIYDFVIKNWNYKVEPSGNNKVILEMHIGEKFDVETFVKTAFIYPQQNDWVKVIVESIKAGVV